MLSQSDASNAPRARNTTQQRHCWDCGGWFPPTTDHFYKDRRRSAGLSAACKTCIKRRANKWNHENKSRRKKQAQRYYDRYMRSTGTQIRVNTREAA